MSTTVNFDIYPDVECSTVASMIEGYNAIDTGAPFILICLRNGAFLQVAVTPENLAAVATWRMWQREHGHLD